jgi:hypothetical protein
LLDEKRLAVGFSLAPDVFAGTKSLHAGGGGKFETRAGSSEQQRCMRFTSSSLPGWQDGSGVCCLMRQRDVAGPRKIPQRCLSHGFYVESSTVFLLTDSARSDIS